MSRYKAYPEYQHSGVAWLGEMPISWTLAPLKWFIDRNDGGVWGDDPDGENDTLVLRSTEQTVDGLWKMDDPAPRKLSANDKSFALLRSGDLVVTKSSGSSLHIGKTTIVNDDIERLECCYSNFMQRIRTSRLLLPRLAWYVMNNEISRAQFDFLSNSTTGLANLNGTMIGQIVLAIPSEVEQQAIINFLDHETAKIDALIEKQQRLIELLKEKRQAVISHAVTKGLNPNAPMKDSGVEWLGEVPSHWELTKGKFLFDFVTSGSRGWAEYYSEEGSLFFRITNLTRDTIYPKLESIQNVLPPAGSEGERSIIRLNDLLISITADLGSVCVADNQVENGYVSQHVALCRPNSKVSSSKWLGFYVLSDSAKEQLLGAGYGGTKIQLSLEDIRELAVIRPSPIEQVEIEEYLEKQLEKFMSLIERSERQVDILKERRTALISAAVTGKIDVRDWQAAA